MKSNFFAPSITLANGTVILTDDNSLQILCPDGNEFEWRASGGEFDECNTETLNYEKLISILSQDGWQEVSVTILLNESLPK